MSIIQRPKAMSYKDYVSKLYTRIYPDTEASLRCWASARSAKESGVKSTHHL